MNTAVVYKYNLPDSCAASYLLVFVHMYYRDHVKNRVFTQTSDTRTPVHPGSSLLPSLCSSWCVYTYHLTSSIYMLLKTDRCTIFTTLKSIGPIKSSGVHFLIIFGFLNRKLVSCFLKWLLLETQKQRDMSWSW